MTNLFPLPYWAPALKRVPIRGSIASHEGLAKEASEQLFSLVVSRRSTMATPMASLRMARSRLGEVYPAPGLSYLCRSPGECGSSHRH